MNVRLVPLLKLPDEKQICLRGRRLVIGRANDCTFRLDHPFVSRHHCEIVLKDGEICVHDLTSRNGTYVNNRLVQDTTRLADRDILCIASVAYRVEIQNLLPYCSTLSRVARGARYLARCVRVGKGRRKLQTA